MYDRKNTKNLAPLKARQGDCVVGFLNKKPIIKAEGFHPIDLNEDNVQAIFERCLATGDTKNLTAPILFALKNGYSEDSKPIVFDKGKITANSATIEYLFAQLHDVHTSKGFIAPMSVTIKYDKSMWTQSKGIILEFLHLGYAAHLFNSFSRVEHDSKAVLFPINPALSPKDPAFPAWWETHQKEWEDLAKVYENR